MTKNEAINALSSGHSMYTVEFAKEVLSTLDIKFKDYLVTKWTGQKDANPDNDPKGLFLDKDEPGEGVASLRLSDYVVGELGLEVEGYLGRGFQARANADRVRQYFTAEDAELGKGIAG